MDSILYFGLRLEQLLSLLSRSRGYIYKLIKYCSIAKAYNVKLKLKRQAFKLEKAAC
jgi:hypothetical protein